RGAVADGRLLSRLGRRRGPRPGAGAERAEILRPGPAAGSQGRLSGGYQARDAWKAGAGDCRRVAFHGRRDYLSREGTEGWTVQAGCAARQLNLSSGHHTKDERT